MTARGSAKTSATTAPKAASSFAHPYASYAVLLGSAGTATPSLPTLSPVTGQIWPRTGSWSASADAVTTGYADATYGRLAAANTYSALGSFHAPGNNALDYSGLLDAAGAAGSFYRASCGLAAISNGINDPARGDSIAVGTGNGAGASFFYGHYLNLGVFSGKGSAQGVSVYASMGSNASYGEIGAYTAGIANGRTGGLVEGFESSLANGSGTPGRLAGFVSVISEANAAITYFTRGYWASSQGAHLAGDAFYVDGAAGWTNFAHFLHTDGTDRFKMDGTGKQFIGAGARTLYDDGTGLKTDAQLIADGGLKVGNGKAGGSYFEEWTLGAQSITNNSFTTLTGFTFVRSLRDYATALVLATGVWTAPVDSVYDFTITMAFSSWVAGSRLVLRVTSAAQGIVANQDALNGSSGGNATLTGSRYISAGDTVTFGVLQVAGASKTVNPAGPAFVSVARRL